MRAAVLIDRDGTVIVEKHYLGDPEGVELEVGAADGLRRLSELGFALIVVSNQSGIARGKYSADAARAVNARCADLLAAVGVRIDGWYFCPHGPDDGCDCRKPAPGMAGRAARDHDLDLGRSFVIGDKRCDVELAGNIGAVGLMVATGHGPEERAWAEAHGVTVCANLTAAAAVIAAILEGGDGAPGAK